MNILHLEASSGWGGQEIRILKESLGMIKRSHNIVIAVAKGGGLASEANKAGIKVYEMDFRKRNWIFAFFKLRKIIRKHNIGIINTHSSLDAWLGGIVGRIFKVPIIRTRHISARIRGGLNAIVLYRYLADVVVTTCEDMVDYICKLSWKDKKQCVSIPTGVDPKTISINLEKVKEFRKGVEAGRGDFLVGLVCFMRSWKGVDDYLRAADILRDDKRIKWVIIGGGHMDEYVKRAEELNISSMVKFTGHLKNPYNAIAALDAFVLLSTANEGVSQASLQASFLKKPLITTTTGGLKEVCINNLTGIQVPIFSPEKVAEAILKLKNDKELCSDMGKNAKRLVEENFTIGAMLNRMEELYLNFSEKMSNIKS